MKWETSATIPFTSGQEKRRIPREGFDGPEPILSILIRFRVLFYRELYYRERIDP
jgi:hypothetical protein